MKVLSIDWDYFMNCSIDDRAVLFPDGGNEHVGIAMSNFIWASRYADNEKELLKIKTRSWALDKLKKWIDTGDYIYRLSILDSHKHLGEFLLNEMLEKTTSESLEIVNIDHHSDLYNIGEDLNCGNWLNKVLDARPNAKLTWIRNEDSKVDPLPDEYKNRVEISADLEAASGSFDVIYLCRSSIWSAPHLDKEFSAFVRFLSKRACGILLRQELPGRYDDDMKLMIRQIKSQRAEFMEAFNNDNSQ